MSDKAIQSGLLWSKVAGTSVEASQQWVLSAMQKHGQSLVGMLWRILGNEQDVCDAYQDTFLQLAHYNFRRKPGNVKAYLFRTASNTAISVLRRGKSQANIRREIALRDGDVESSVKTHELDVMELREELRGYIARLPEHLREVILLRDLGELSYGEVARILGISPASARVYRCRAVGLLAARMADRKVR